MKPDPRRTTALRRESEDQVWARISRAALIATALLTYLRLFIGMDFGDEAFYNSLPYSFVLGLRPYHDELNLGAQNGGILLLPFFYIYDWLVGSSDGLVLFNRHLYFLFLSFCSYLTYLTGRAYVGRNYGRMLAAFTLTFSYFNIPSLSYNTLGAFFLFSGLFQLLIYARPEAPSGRPWLIFGANSCFVLSAFAYPTLLLSSLTGFGVSFWLLNQSSEPGSRIKHCRMIWATSLACGVAAAIGFVGYVGLDSLRDALAYSKNPEGGHDLLGSAPAKARMIGYQLRQLSFYLVGFAVLLAAPILPGRCFPKRRRDFFLAVVATAAAILLLLHRQPSLAIYPAGSAPLLLSFGLLAVVALRFVPNASTAKVLAVVICLPAFVAAVAAAFSSTTGIIAAGLGLFPAAVGGLLALGLIGCSIDRKPDSNGVRLKSIMGALIPILVFQINCLLERSYGDAPFAGPSRTVFASGPYAGILTSEPSARGLALIRADLNTLVNARTLFINGELPAGYLLSRLKPRTFSTWFYWPTDVAYRSVLFRRVFDSTEPPPDVIMQIHATPEWMKPELNRLHYKVHLERPELGYSLLVRERG